MAGAASAFFSPATFTITGDIVCDNEVRIYTAATESPSMVVNYTGISKCFSATPQVVSFSTTDRYLYLTCWSDDGVAQGLLHDLQVDAVPVLSGDPQWRVLPCDSNLTACISPGPGVIEAAMASRIPTGTFVAQTVGCQNLPAGCYGTWGQFAAINSLSRWSWFNSGQQVSTNAPFQPGFNHRELLIFRLDMQVVPTATKRSTWSQVKTIYR